MKEGLRIGEVTGWRELKVCSVPFRLRFTLTLKRLTSLVLLGPKTLFYKGFFWAIWMLRVRVQGRVKENTRTNAQSVNFSGCSKAAPERPTLHLVVRVRYLRDFGL